MRTVLLRRGHRQIFVRRAESSDDDYIAVDEDSDADSFSCSDTSVGNEDGEDEDESSDSDSTFDSDCGESDDDDAQVGTKEALGRNTVPGTPRRRRRRAQDPDSEEDDEDFDLIKEEVKSTTSLRIAGKSRIRVSAQTKQMRKRKRRKAGSSNKRKTTLKKKATKSKKTTAKKPKRKRRRSSTAVQHHDEDFIVKERVEFSKPITRRKKSRLTLKKRRASSSSSARVTIRRRANSDTSDFEYVVSSDGSLERLDEIERSTVNRIRGRRKKSSNVDESDSFDTKNVSDGELQDLDIIPPPALDVKPAPLRRRLGRAGADGERVDKGKGNIEEVAMEYEKPLCGICLSEEQKTTIRGALDCCSHFFCFPCILEWSKVESKCPICKQRFATITKSSQSFFNLAKVRSVVRVRKKDQVYQPSEDELRDLFDPYENVVCIECNCGGDDNLMLLCDICDSAAHTYCVGLGREIPEGNWYCDCCITAVSTQIHSRRRNQVADQVAEAGTSRIRRVDSSSRATGHAGASFGRSSSNGAHPSSSQHFDLNNCTAQHLEQDCSSAASQVPVDRRTTLSGRRAIQQHIRSLIQSSSRRQPTSSLISDVSHENNVLVPSSDSSLFSQEIGHRGQVQQSGSTSLQPIPSTLGDQAHEHSNSSTTSAKEEIQSSEDSSKTDVHKSSRRL